MLSYSEQELTQLKQAVKFNNQKRIIKNYNRKIESREKKKQFHSVAVIKKHNRYEEEQKVKVVSSQVKRYLKIIFKYYCQSRESGKLPTFQQIQIKNNSMNLNCFMNFIRDFQVAKLPNLKIAFIMDLFKKQSQRYVQMNEVQFFNVLLKISSLSFPSEHINSQNNQEKDPNICQQLLQFLHLNSKENFISKTRQLNIKHNIRNQNTPFTNKNITKKIQTQPQDSSRFMIKNNKSQRQLSTKKINQKITKKTTLTNPKKNIEEIVEGYVNRHRLKIGKQLYLVPKIQKKRQILNKSMKLNNVISIARNQMEQNNNVIEQEKLILLESLIKKRQKKDQRSQINIKKMNNLKLNDEAQILSLFEYDQEDQFLKEHLDKEEKKETKLKR